MIRRRVSGGMLAVLLITAGCRQGRSPVGTLAVDPDQLTLAWPQYRELEVEIAPGAPLPEGVERPTAFLHLLDEPGSVQRTFDHPLPQDWQVGSPIRYRVRLYQSALAEPLAPGTYPVSMGIYDRSAGRFALDTAGKALGREEYQVATVTVPPVEPGAPQARFSENWTPPEPGSDRQVLVRRVLRAGAPGTVQFGPFTGGGTLLVGVELPVAQPVAGPRLELDPGAEEPRLRVSSSCGGEQAEVSGGGRFDLEMRVAPGEAPVVCQLTFEPNFRLTWSETSASTSILLDMLAWRPAAGAATPTD